MEKPLDRFQRTVLKTYLWILGIGGAYVLWIKRTGKGLACAVNASTGLLCPGCGSSRMFLALLRLDFGAAWRHVELDRWGGFLGKTGICAESRISIRCVVRKHRGAGCIWRRAKFLNTNAALPEWQCRIFSGSRSLSGRNFLSGLPYNRRHGASSWRAVRKEAPSRLRSDRL